MCFFFSPPWDLWDVTLHLCWLMEERLRSWDLSDWLTQTGRGRASSPKTWLKAWPFQMPTQLCCTVARAEETHRISRCSLGHSRKPPLYLLTVLPLGFFNGLSHLAEDLTSNTSTEVSSACVFLCTKLVSTKIELLLGPNAADLFLF